MKGNKEKLWKIKLNVKTHNKPVPDKTIPVTCWIWARGKRQAIEKAKKCVMWDITNRLKMNWDNYFFDVLEAKKCG